MNVGQFGSALELDVAVDLTGADKYWMRIVRPDHTEFTVDHAALTIVAVNPGVLSYTFARTDLSVAGLYLVQVFLEYTTAGIGLVSVIGNFTVDPILGTAGVPFT